MINSSGDFADGFQSHTVYSGYGANNHFADNDVVGPIPGFGFGLYPLAGNVVGCSNTAPDAALGLVGVSSQPASCVPDQ